MNPWKIARFHRWRRITLKLGGFTPSSPYPRRQKKGPLRKRYVLSPGVAGYVFTKRYLYDCDYYEAVIDKIPRRR